MPRHGAWRSAVASAPHRSQPELPAQPSSHILSLAWLRADAVTVNLRCMDPSDATSATALHAALSGLRPHPSHSRPWSLPCHARTQPTTAPLSQSTRTARRRPAGLGLVAVGLPHPHTHSTGTPRLEPDSFDSPMPSPSWPPRRNRRLASRHSAAPSTPLPWSTGWTGPLATTDHPTATLTARSELFPQPSPLKPRTIRVHTVRRGRRTVASANPDTLGQAQLGTTNTHTHRSSPPPLLDAHHKLLTSHATTAAPSSTSGRERTWPPRTCTARSCLWFSTLTRSHTDCHGSVLATYLHRKPLPCPSLSGVLA
jgi:hypothetical protein